MKYKVRLLNDDITAEDKRVFVKAISADTAKRIAETFNKGYKAEVAIRQTGEQSVAQKLEELGIAYQVALSEGNEEVAQELKSEYVNTVAMVKKSLNVVAWGIAKKEIVELS